MNTFSSHNTHWWQAFSKPKVNKEHKTPEIIYLIEDDGSYIWSDDPVGESAIKYVRYDLT